MLSVIQQQYETLAVDLRSEGHVDEMQLKAAEELNRCLRFQMYAATERMFICKQQIAACNTSKTQLQTVLCICL